MSLVFNNTEIPYMTWNGNPTTGVFNGNVVWSLPVYSEVLLWSGNTTANNQKLNLSQHPSAFDTIKVLTYGANQDHNTIHSNPIYADYKELSSFNSLYIGNDFWGSIASTGVTNSWWFAGMFTGTSGQQWTWTSAYGRNWNTTAYSNRYDFTQAREIWGIKYGL